MDIIIVLIVIAAAALYIGNIFFQKFKAARSGKSDCSCSTCPGSKNCNAGPIENYELKNRFV